MEQFLKKDIWKSTLLFVYQSHRSQYIHHDYKTSQRKITFRTGYTARSYFKVSLDQTLPKAVHSYMAIHPSDNQLIDRTTFVLEVLTVNGYGLRLFGPRHSFYTNYLCHASEAVGTIFNVLSYDANCYATVAGSNKTWRNRQ